MDLSFQTLLGKYQGMDNFNFYFHLLLNCLRLLVMIYINFITEVNETLSSPI